MSKLFLASTFAAWAGAMWVVWREARLSIAAAPLHEAAAQELASALDLAPLPPVTPVLATEAPRLRPSPRVRAPEPADEPASAVDAEADGPTTADISGEVVDHDGTPLRTAVLTARCSGRVYEREMRGSSFRLLVAPGSCTVFASDHLGRSQSRSFFVAAGETVSLTLAPRGLDEAPAQ